MSSAISTITAKHFLSITPGETKVIKKSATVLSVINYGGVSYTTTCGALPAAENALCYNAIFSINDNQGASPNLEAPDSYFSSLEVLGKIYTANIVMMGSPELAIRDFILQTVPQGIFKLKSIVIDFVGERSTYLIYFQTIPVVVDTIKIKITGPGYDNGLYVLPKELSCDSLPTPATISGSQTILVVGTVPAP